jgi:hypothetical protein
MSQEQPPNLVTLLDYYVRHYGMTYEEGIGLLREGTTSLSKHYKAYGDDFYKAHRDDHTRRTCRYCAEMKGDAHG